MNYRNADPETGSAEFLIDGRWQRRGIVGLRGPDNLLGMPGGPEPEPLPGCVLEPLLSGWREIDIRLLDDAQPAARRRGL